MQNQSYDGTYRYSTWVLFTLVFVVYLCAGVAGLSFSQVQLDTLSCDVCVIGSNPLWTTIFNLWKARGQGGIWDEDIASSQKSER